MASNKTREEVPVRDPWPLRDWPCLRFGGKRWRLWLDRERRSAACQVAEDIRLLADVSAGGPPVIRVWENVPSLVVSRADVRLVEFRRAVSVLAGEGTPVVVRDTGGTAVVQGPGILNISLCYGLDNASEFSISSSYKLLCRLVCDLLSAQGLEPVVGAVPGSFCDGKYNIVLQEKKVAGTAQRVRRYKGRVGVLSHLTLLVDPSLPHYCQLLRRFYLLAAGSCEVSMTNTTSVEVAKDGSELTPDGERGDLPGMYSALLEKLYAEGGVHS